MVHVGEIFVATVDQIQGHPAPEMLEEYAFCRLSETETETIEQHLLICETCQTSLAEVDEYVVLMKHATARIKPGTYVAPAAARWLSPKGRSVTWKPALTGALLAAGVIAVLALRTQAPNDAREPVQLAALRGVGTDQINHAHSGKLLDLNIDLTGLPAAERYRVEIVNAAGHGEWNGEVAASPNVLSLQLPKRLKSGQYWVRLYSANELQREFSLRVD
jgi:hypothetical protein